MMVLIATAVLASHPESSLAGSNFELDTDANLKVDDTTPPSVDWANLAEGANGPERRAVDLATGQNDDSYKGGVKEDTSCPEETTGSIPNNKSDLLTFSVYQEPGVGSHPGFLHLAWSRVTDPSGTTLMDFEFNQSNVSCSVGPNRVRTAGDLLLEYSIDQGGSRADLTARTWSGTAWGAPADIDAPSTACGGNPCAAGTINSSVIPAADSDGLITTGQKEARTFGEASIDLRLIFQPNSCRSFGSAMIKSRSSDSFTSQLKDFIRPLGITLTNCGQVIIRKETDPDGATVLFDYTKSFTTDPTSANTFQLADGGSQPFTGVLFGTGYTVAESATLPTGWEFVGIDCAVAGHPSVGVTPSISGRTITFAIDNASDVLDCTYTNKARATINIHKQDNLGGALANVQFQVITDAAPVDADGQPPRGAEDTSVAGSCTTNASGDCSVANLVPGAYWVHEVAPPAGHQAAPDQWVNLTAGASVTLTFIDNRVPAQINITKRDDDSPPNALNGAIFTLFTDAAPQGPPDAGGSNQDQHGAEDTAVAGKTCTTAGTGTCSITGIEPGTYWVVETFTPAGYDTAPDQHVVLSLAQTVPLTFVNPRDFKVIVFVCRESTNTLYSSTVTFEDTNRTSLATTLLPAGITEATLCGLTPATGGAVYSDLSFGDYNDDQNGVLIPQ